MNTETAPKGAGRAAGAGARPAHRLAACAATLVLALAGTVAVAPTARADDLPTGTFKLLTSQGGCADVEYVRSFWVAIRNNCATLDTGQQLVYDLLTKQIHALSNPGLCFESQAGLFGYALAMRACDNALPGQKWERYVVAAGGVYAVKPYNTPSAVLSTAAVDLGQALGVDAPVNPLAPAYTWTFTLL
ncbi:RICIN domain-containing protein [Saccharothrix syringae]|uniref:Ricin B lectin domain-containing protein n=1 Tax=Saccharothrix syringae TaxID=103733 RepID=A0A5Q0H9Z2_SACSY|nr:hypothetical protein [Saccharothrix syringae]QFZ23041.1 hypothetical protein EKG83_41415 [Saccharothrix syringae]